MPIQITKDFDLKKFNTFGVAAKAAECVRIKEAEQLEEVREILQERPDSSFLVLGGGSDILFTKDFPGIVILMENKGITEEGEDDLHYYVRAAAGENWHAFVRRMVLEGRYGLENLALIPGTVGGAPIQNIGAYGLEVGQRIESVHCFDLETGTFVDLQHDECQFDYRTSVFKAEESKRYIIVSVLFKLHKVWEPVLTYKELKREIENNRPPILKVEDVFASVISLRIRKLPDPQKIGNAGSFFKNPTMTKAEFMPILRDNPDVVFYPIDEDNVKISAAWLIDAAGLKGLRMGNCGTYDRQPLVIVNYGQANGEEIYEMAQSIRTHVKNSFGIRLKPEVVIV